MLRGKSTGRPTSSRIAWRAGGPRRLSSCTRNCLSVGCNCRRKGAGEAAAASCNGRKQKAAPPPSPAATCRRRRLLAGRWPRNRTSSQSRLAATPPQRRASTPAHRASRGRRGNTRCRQSRRIPAEAQAGAWAQYGGAISTTACPLRVSSASAGSSRPSSPMPSCSASSSVRTPRGQPPPGSSASSREKPEARVGVGATAKASPRRMSLRSSRWAKAGFMLKKQLNHRDTEAQRKSQARKIILCF